MIKAIIFDFYGVICNEIGTKWYTTKPDAKLIPELKIKYDTPSDYGHISETEFFEGIAASVGQTALQTRNEWLTSANINLELVPYIQQLKSSGYKIALCSNTVTELFYEIIKMNNLQNLFDVVVASSEIGMIKPFPDIYQYTLNELSVEANESVFIDDRLANCKGAHNLGIQSFLFEGVGKLKKDLKKIL